MQVLGSHNSYKPYPDPAAEMRIRTLAPRDWGGLAYGHPPLEAQLTLGLRQIATDVAPDPLGGLDIDPYLMATPEARGAMAAPGAKVLHIAGIDTASHCLTFRACLGTLRRWSDAHPGHLPITGLVNAGAFEAAADIWAHDAQFDAAGLDALDADIASAASASSRLMQCGGSTPRSLMPSERTIGPAWPRRKANSCSYSTVRTAMKPCTGPAIPHCATD